MARQLFDFVTVTIRNGNASSHGDLDKALPDELQAGPLRQRFEWSADLVQAGIAIVSPVISVVLLLINLERKHVVVILLVVLVLVVAATVVLLFSLWGMTPGEYETYARGKGRPWEMSYVTYIGIALNVLGALVAAVLAVATTEL